MTCEQSKLVEDNHNLIYHVLLKYHLPIDEYYGTAAVGLCKAAVNYKESLAKFSTYAVSCMTNELKMELRKYTASKRTAEEISIQKPLNTEGTTLADLLPDEKHVSSGDTACANVHFKQAWKMLTDDQREICSLLADGKTQDEIGRATKRSQATVCRHINKIRDILNG